MLDKLEIENKVRLVAKSQLDIWDFHRWLQESSWNAHQDSSEGAIQLAEDIKLSFEEYYQGKLNEYQLQECLLSTPIIYVRPAPSAVSMEVLPYQRVVTTDGLHPALAFA